MKGKGVLKGDTLRKDMKWMRRKKLAKNIKMYIWKAKRDKNGHGERRKEEREVEERKIKVC